MRTRTLDATVDSLVAFSPRAASLAGDLRALFDALNDVEAQHVRRGLADPAFPFEAAQVELEAAFHTFASVAREALCAAGDALRAAERGEVEDLARLALGAPLVTRPDLEVIRAARVARGAPATA